MKRKGTTVRLTDRAHILLSERADEYDTSMKAVASEAIFLYLQGEDRDSEQRAHTEQLKFKARKFKQLAVFYILLIGIGIGLLGFIVGLVVK